MRSSWKYSFEGADVALTDEALIFSTPVRTPDGTSSSSRVVVVYGAITEVEHSPASLFSKGSIKISREPRPLTVRYRRRDSAQASAFLDELKQRRVCLGGAPAADSSRLTSAAVSVASPAIAPEAPASRSVGQRPAPPGATPNARHTVSAEPAPRTGTSTSAPSGIEVTDEFRQALDLLHAGRSMFLTGKAGTGKSTLIRHFMEGQRGRVVVAAPTGIAALNVDGLTIHRLFSFGASTTLDDVASGNYRPGRFARVIAGMDTLIIDEASMVRADLLDQVEVALRRYGPRPGEPFGGVQIVLVGDLFQLPPVVPEREKAWLESRYDTEYFYSAHAYSAERFPTVALTKVFRQLGDCRLTGLLNAVREGLLADAMRADLNSRHNAQFSPPDDEFWLTVAPTNSIVTSRNRAALERLPGDTLTHPASVWGDISNFDSPVDHVVTYKVGAQVMLLNNDSRGRWVNGTIGKIEGVSDETVSVRLNGGDVVEVKPHTWEVTEPRMSGGSLTREVVGGFIQMPFKLAWAVTIHKCQGLTLDRLIVDLSGGTFAFGQAYVALSRCTSMDGLVLRRPLEARHLQTDRRVVRFLAGAVTQAARGHVAIAALTVGQEDVRSKPRPVEIAMVFDDGTKVSTLINPERDLTGARELGIGVDDITLAPNLAEAWPVLTTLLGGSIPVGVDLDRTLGFVDWELKRLGAVHALPPGVEIDPQQARGGEIADLVAPTALRRARAALAIHRRGGGGTGAPFTPADQDVQPTYLLSRDTIAVEGAGPAMASLLKSSRVVADAVLRGRSASPGSVADGAMVQVVAARLASVAEKSAGLSPTLLERLSLLAPSLGVDLGAELASSQSDATTAVFRGARVCFTGDAVGPDGLPLSRTELKAIAADKGLVPVDSVTKTRCNLLVAAELGTQSGKARKAAEYGKPVISVADFLAAQPAEPPPVTAAEASSSCSRGKTRRATASPAQARTAAPTPVAVVPAVGDRVAVAAWALALQREGRSSQEIGEVIGVSVHGVKDLLSDARFYEAPESYSDRLALARKAAEMRATTTMNKTQIAAALDAGSKAAARLFRDVEYLSAHGHVTTFGDGDN